MIRVGVFGANGRMGRILIEAACQHRQVSLGFASVRNGSAFEGIDAGELAGIHKQNVAVAVINETLAISADILIDFTLPDALAYNLEYACKHNKPIVIGTTGLNKAQLALIDQAALSVPIVFAANYSVGVNVMLDLVETAAAVMGDQADIEIIEAHHRFKKDAPSGTAMAIGERIANTLNRDLATCAVYGREGDTGERTRDTIGFATIRAGDIVGEHTVLFATLGERLEITHKASNRLTFGNGAITAAVWIKAQKPGLYSMRQVLNLAK